MDSVRGKRYLRSCLKSLLRHEISQIRVQTQGAPASRGAPSPKIMKDDANVMSNIRQGVLNDLQPNLRDCSRRETF